MFLRINDFGLSASSRTLLTAFVVRGLNFIMYTLHTNSAKHGYCFDIGMTAWSSAFLPSPYVYKQLTECYCVSTRVYVIIEYKYSSGSYFSAATTL